MYSSGYISLHLYIFYIFIFTYYHYILHILNFSCVFSFPYPTLLWNFKVHEFNFRESFNAHLQVHKFFYDFRLHCMCGNNSNEDRESELKSLLLCTRRWVWLESEQTWKYFLLCYSEIPGTCVCNAECQCQISRTVSERKLDKESGDFIFIICFLFFLFCLFLKKIVNNITNFRILFLRITFSPIYFSSFFFKPISLVDY